MNWQDRLESELRAAVSRTPRDIPEKEVLEAALEVAAEWRARLREIESWESQAKRD